MQLQLANFIRGRLAANITAASTSIPLTAAAFPALAGGAVCYAVLQSATDRSVVEIVKVTAGGATLTVVRGQEGTVARAFAANDIIEQRLTAGQFQSVVDHANTASAHVPAGVAGKFLKGVVDGAPVWGMPTAQDVGALPIVGGDLTGPLGVQTINGQGSSIGWASLDVRGVKGTYSGLNFPDVGYWFGVNTAGVSGVFNSAGDAKWYFNENGWLGGGAVVPWNIIANHPSRTNWANAGASDIVSGQLAWKNYGNGHTIFDASAGTSPDGTAVDKTNAQVGWSATYPTLMGWNGANTYGVRVDYARRADGTGWADGAAHANRLDGDVIKTSGQDLTFWDKRAMVGDNTGNQLIINYANDWGSTAILGQTYLQTVESNRHVVVHNGSTVYANSGLEVRTTDGSDARIGFHRAGYTAGAINHNAWGFQFERESGGGSRANVAAANFFADAAQDTAGNALTRKDYVDSNLDAKAGIEHVHNVATQAAAGFMSSADKLKLDNLGSGGVADSANKLTTPRSINGTSFDGTTDITTSSWGASRTITIGNKSKVVNGSSDVSWSTAELGCLPLTGGTLSGSLKVNYGVYVQRDGYPLNFCSLQVYDNVATIMSNSNLTSGFRVTTNDTTCFLVDPAGELYANGIYRVYHTNNKPTASDVGLGLVNNTSDLNKPISTATQTALNSKEATIALGATTQYWRGDKSWQSLNKAAVGLGNVNDTSDLNKPISTATQTALNDKYSPSNRPTPADIGALPAAGTAVAATKLATARTIAGKSFDGTANISIAAADVGALPASGGTLSGGLITSSTIKLADTSATDTSGLLNPFGRTIVRGSTIAANVFGNYTDAMFLYGNSLTAWQVRYNNISYPIYHTGNKPTPAEIGAQPATSDIRVKSNIASLSPVLDKIMLIDPKTFTMEGREGTCVGTIAQDWEVDFPEVILNVPSTSQGEPEMLKGIDALGTIGILLKAIQELKGEIEELKNR